MGIFRRFLQHLEQSVGGLGAGFLRDEELGVAHDEHLAVARRRPRVREAPQHLHVGQVDADGLTGRRRPERLLAPKCQLRASRLLEGLAQPVRAARNLRSRQRKEPVDVRMAEAKGEMAGCAPAARPLGFAGLADEVLGEPQAEPLLARAAGAVEQKGVGQLAGRGGAREARTDRLVAVNRAEAGTHHLAAARDCSQVSGSTGAGTWPWAGART